GGLTGGESWMDLVKEHERYYSQKIQDRLAFTSGSMVSVTVDPQMQQKEIKKITYDKPGSFSQPTDVDERSDESNNIARPPGEPGVNPNTGGGANKGADIAGAGAGGGENNSTTTTQTKTKYQVFANEIQEWIRSAAGASV